jgi:hypothetical protein
MHNQKLLKMSGGGMEHIDRMLKPPSADIACTFGKKKIDNLPPAGVYYATIKVIYVGKSQ